MNHLPSYIHTCKSGKINHILDQLISGMESCELCPRRCKVNRLEGETGICETSRRAKVSSYGPHYGEESCLSGRRGSGTIFFNHCNLLCSFCQNYDISHQGYGREVTDDQLAGLMLELQEQGCHNINFVTPSHVIPQIVSAVSIACESGLNIPLVYNSGGYDSVSSLQLLDGIIDIYMPDMKFSDPGIAKETCDAPDYFEVAKKAVKEMHRQTGDLQIDEQGIATKGLLVRHLILPEGLAGTEEISNFLAREISTDTFINIMDQYRPCFQITSESPIGRRISSGEYRKAVEVAQSKGLYRFDQ